MKVKAASCPTLAAVAYAVFAVFGLAIWYPLLFVSVPERTSSLQVAQELLAVEPSGSLLALHTVASLVAAVFAAVLFVRPILTRQARITASLVSTTFAAATWALYWSDTALLPTVSAVALVWNHFKPQGTAQ